MAQVQPLHTSASERPAEPTTWAVDPLTGGMKDRDAASRSAFLRMVSHELRTPLNSIIGFSELMRAELYGPLGAPAYVEYAGIIHESGAKLLSLFNSVIEIMRLEGGGHGYEPMLDPVLPALEEATAKLRSQARARGISIDIRTFDDRMCAVYDARALSACLDHLLRNALDFTADGEAIEVDAVATGAQVEISVFNRGDAPDPADINRLMQPFEQGDCRLSRTREGAGLGWAIVRLNAQAMGGTFQVTSRKGEYLRASISLQRM